MRVLFFLFAIFASDVQAQNYSVRDGETVLSGAELSDAIVGQPILFYDNGEARYSAGGAYSYTYYQGQTEFGAFTLQENGQACIAFENGFTRCDQFVRNDRGLVLLTEDGERYPIR